MPRSPLTEAALASARDATHGALAHAELPFERIVADLNPPRQPRRNPVSQPSAAARPTVACRTANSSGTNVTSDRGQRSSGGDDHSSSTPLAVASPTSRAASRSRWRWIGLVVSSSGVTVALYLAAMRLLGL